MYKILCYLFIALSLPFIATSQSGSEKQVAAALEELRQAMIEGNRGRLTAIAHDGLMYGHSGGKIETKAEFVENIAVGNSDFITLDFTNPKIKVVKKTAIVSMELSAKTNDRGVPGEVHLKQLLTFVKEGGHWKMLGRQAVKNPPPAPASVQYDPRLGAFSMSLNVKDLAASQRFYEQLGFKQFGGEPSRNYVILKNGETVIGLFKGMMQANALTFNPGWNQDAKNIDPFDDVRKIQSTLLSRGITLLTTTDTGKTGPGFLVLTDPDGNQILIDQHR